MFISIIARIEKIFIVFCLHIYIVQPIFVCTIAILNPVLSELLLEELKTFTD